MRIKDWENKALHKTSFVPQTCTEFSRVNSPQKVGSFKDSAFALSSLRSRAPDRQRSSYIPVQDDN